MNNYSKQDVKEAVSDAHPTLSSALGGEEDADESFCLEEGDRCAGPGISDASCCPGLKCDYLGKSLRSVCQKPKPEPTPKPPTPPKPTCTAIGGRCRGGYFSKESCCDGLYCPFLWWGIQRCRPKWD